jgi:DNA repair exonuclease SbcCD ATPase subunit
LETTIANYQETISKNATKIRELDDQLMYNNSEKDLQQSHLDVVNKFETALKRDFRGYLLSTIIDYIQQRAKSYSQVIFETDKVGFCLDGNNIDITYLDKAYENLSGGEKQKIDLIIQFSIRDMLCNHLGFTSNILVLDEVFDGLDSIGCQRVLDVISSLSDIKNIFIVTHRKDLSIPTDKEIIVVKSASGISEIR